MYTCKFHPEVYSKYTKKNGHRILNPIFGKEIQCKVCGKMVIIGQPHPPLNRRPNRYWVPESIEPPTNIQDGFQVIKDEFALPPQRGEHVEIDNDLLRMILARRRPKKSEPMSTNRAGQTILLPEGNLIAQVVYDIENVEGQIVGHTWNENWEAPVYFIGDNNWTLAEYMFDYSKG